MNMKPYSASVLAIAGLLLTCMGLYFIFLRPSLLPEDLLYMGTTFEKCKDEYSRSFQLVTKSWLTVFISFTSFRTRTFGSFGIVALAGITSIGSMTVVNFIINSDFQVAFVNVFATLGNCANCLPAS